MGWGTAIASAFAAVAAYFGWANTKEKEKNTAEMQANKTAEDRQDQADRVVTEVEKASKGDAKTQEKLREEWSEN